MDAAIIFSLYGAALVLLLLTVLIVVTRRMLTRQTIVDDGPEVQMGPIRQMIEEWLQSSQLPEPVPLESRIATEEWLESMDSNHRDCAICLAQYSVGDDLGVVHPCTHVFHADCVRRWLETTPDSTCPNCRTVPGPVPATTSLPADDEIV